MKFVGKLSKGEYILWALSALAVTISFLVSGAGSWLNLVASLVGVTALIFIARGYPICHVFFVIFAILYAIISYDLAYYGEMITYLGMSAPACIVNLISWLRHPYADTAEVKVRKINKKHVLQTIIFTILVTIAFYFILKFLGTANIWVSTLSVATSFLASYLSFLRSPYYALGYVLNDIVLVVLWSAALVYDFSYLSVVVLFSVFLINDVHGFISWQKMEKRQNAN